MSQNLATSAPTKRAYSKKIHSNHKISGFATAWLHALPDIETILKQVRRAVGYTAKKNAIRTQYERDIQAFAHLPTHEAQVCALVNAQKAADCANGYAPYTPTPAEITHFYALASGEIAENGAESVSGSLKTTEPNPTISIERKRKSNHAAPILCRAIRHFPTQQKASVYLSHRVKACANDRFIIQQVNQHKWAVCRVLSGGVA